MATSPGQRFVRRHNAARSSTSNTTAADISYDTAVLSEGGYSWSSPEVTVDEAGLYLFIFDLGQCDLASSRAVGSLVPSINTTDQTRFRATHRYLRNSGGAQHGASIGMCILDLSASDDVKVRNPGSLSDTDFLGNYATNASFGGGIQLIRLNAGNFTHVERTSNATEVGTSNINATRPWLDSSGTWTKITYNSEVNDDDNLYSGSGGDITLGANKKYLITWGVTAGSTDGSRHTYVTRLSIDGDNVQTGSGYQRNTASQGPPMCGMYLHETGGSTETMYLECTHEIEGGDAGTPNVHDAYLQCIELPSDAEWIHVDNGTTDSLTLALNNTATWYDTPLSSTFRADGDSNLSLDSGNDAVQNDSGGTLPILAIGWHRWDRDSGVSGARKGPWTRWDNGGSTVGYGIASAFSRGQQSSDDCFQAHYTSAATMDLANAADLSFQVNDEATGSQGDMGIYASTASNRHFLGVQVLNLNTIAPASDTEVNANVDNLTLTEQQATVSLDVDISAGVDSLTLTENAANVQLLVEGASHHPGRPLQANLLTTGFMYGNQWHATVLTPKSSQFVQNTEIAANVDALTLTEQQATITLDVNVDTNVDSLTLTENQATITLDVNVDTNLDTLTLTENQSTITLDVNVDTNVDSLTLAEFQATIGLDVNVDTNVDALTLNEFQATISEDTNIDTNVDALTLTELQSTIVYDVEVQTNLDTLTLTELQASITLGVDVQAGVDTLTLAEQQATVSLDIDISASVDTLTLTENQADVSLGVNISANTDSLTLTENQATITYDVDVQAGTDTLTLTENQGTITRNIDVQALTDALSLSEHQAGVTYDVEVSASTDALTLSENASTITRDIDVQAGVDGLTLTTYTADLSEATNISAGVDNLTLTELQSTITRNVEVLAGVDSLTLNTFQASLAEDTVVNANLATLTLTELLAGIGYDVNVTTSLDALSLNEYQASIDTGAATGRRFRALVVG